MTRRMYWRIAILILLLGTAAVFIIKHEMSENHGLKGQLKEEEKLANQIKQIQALKDSPPPAKPGFN